MNPRILTPSLSLLLSFEASARHQSYTRAAEELLLTQSAVSRQVQTLEHLLAVNLFIRKGRRIELTDAGKIYMREISYAISVIQNATLQAMTYRSSGGNFNLAVLPTFSAHWLMPKLHLFYASHQNVIIHMHSKIGSFDLEASGIDAVICVSSKPLANLISHHLLDEELVLVISPKLLERHPINSAKDLDGLLLLRVASQPNIWEKWLNECKISLHHSYLGPTFELTSHLIQATMTGIGVGLVPKCLVEDDIQNGKLVIPFEFEYYSGRSYYFAYPAHKAQLSAIVLFRDWLLTFKDISD
ncbi:LysR substrate-binding domain-containing protein [Acinetobacter guillouiae]|uniref:LysR substrate-binding domain-containing protein n=1 Tax=Acinetobacter guillouiae TaxID=106649 RepID=UPI002FDB183F